MVDLCTRMEDMLGTMEKMMIDMAVMAASQRQAAGPPGPPLGITQHPRGPTGPIPVAPGPSTADVLAAAPPGVTIAQVLTPQLQAAAVAPVVAHVVTPQPQTQTPQPRQGSQQ